MKTLHTIYTSFAKRVAFILTLLLTIGVTSAWGANVTFERITSTNELTSGAKYLIVYESGTLILNGSSVSSGANTETKSVTISNNTITCDESYAFTITSSSNSWKITGSNGKSIGHSGSSNTLNTGTFTNTISFSSNDVVIGCNSRTLRCNTNNGSPLFRYYKSGQQAIQLYKLKASTFTVTCQSNNSSYGTVSQPSVVTNVANNTAISANGNTLTVGTTTVTATPKAQDANYNYEFTGWTGIPSGNKVTANCTITANFTRTERPLTNYRTTCEEPSTFTVTYDENGATSGSVPTGATEYARDAQVTVLGNTGNLAKTGYTFSGWNTEADGTGTTYAAGDKFTITENTTLYAKWTANTYTITLNTNDGTINSGAISSYTYGVGATLPTDVTKTGYTFAGWYNNSDFTGDPIKTIGTTETGKKDFWAKWTPAVYTINYKDQGDVAFSGTHAEGHPMTHTYNTETTLKSASKDHYTFGGWYKESNCSGTAVTTLGATEYTDEITLYAKWTANTYTITFNAGTGECVTGSVTTTNVGGVTLPTATHTCPDWTFAGWWTEEVSSTNTSPGTLMKAGDAYNPTSDITLYAVYSTQEAGDAFTGYAKVTTAPDDWSGKYLLSTGTYTATGAFDDTGKEGHLVRETYTPSTDEKTEWEFTLAKVDNTGYSILFPDGTWYLGHDDGTYFGRSIDVDNAAYLWTPSTNGISNVNATSRKIADNGSADFRPYSSPSSSNIVYLYKRVGGGSTTIYNSNPTCLVPVWNGATIDKTSFTVNCGETSSTNGAARISFPKETNFNLYKDITVEVTSGNFIIASSRDGEYSTSVTLSPTQNGENVGTFANKYVYVRAVAPPMSSNQLTGTITISGKQITTQVINVTATVTCNEYTLTFNDCGDIKTITDFAGTSVEEMEPWAETCSEPFQYVFDGWATEPVTNGTEEYEKVNFSTFTMPNNNTTILYAVYRYAEEGGEPVNGYVKVTEALADWSGDYVIVNETAKKAIGNAYNNNNNNTLTAIDVAIENDKVVSPSENVIWQIRKSGSWYTMYNATAEKYAYITQNKSEAAGLDNKSQNLSISFNNGIVKIYGETITRCFSYYSTNTEWRTYSTQTYSTGALYRLAEKTIRYTSSLVCGTIEAEDALVTSTKDQKVKVKVPITLNYSEAASITGTSDNEAFTVVTKNNVAVGESNIEVHYKPTAYVNTANQEETATITLTTSNGATTTFNVTGRCLPETFAIVAKVGNIWYALPSQGLNSGTTPVGYPVEVDNQDDPTVVTAVPANADWSLRQVYASSGSNDRFADNGEKLVFVNDANPQKALNAGSTGNYLLTGAQYDGYHNTTTPGLYEWTPTTTDLKTYQLTNEQRSRTLSVNTATVFGVHSDNKATTEVRFLPIQNRYTPAALQVVEWKENSVVIMYNGDPAQTASVSVNGAAAQNTTLSAEQSQRDIAVYELAATGLADNPTQRLSITIGAEKTILSIPYIISGEKTDLALLPGSTVAARQEVAKVSDLVILNGATLTADGAEGNLYKFRNVTIYGGGSLIIPAGKGFGANTLTMRVGGVENRQYKNLYPQLQLKGTLTNTSGQINLDYLTTNDFYYPLSVPYSVIIADIQYPVDIYGANVTSNNTGSFQFKYYDGAERAAGKTGWIVLNETANPTLEPNKGYAIWGIPKKINGTRQKFGIHRLPLKEAASNMMTSEKQPHSATINVYNGSKRDSDNGWNYLGNPYLSHYGDFTTADNVMKLGKLVWDEAQGAWLPTYTEQRYVVFTNDCQNYTAELASTTAIPAFSAFFIQADQGGAINFTSPNVATPQSLAARRSEEETKEITTGIILSGEKHSDRTGLLIADQFTEAYEFNADLSKFDNQDMNLYTISSSGKLAFMAINEDLAKQTIPLGYSVSTDGMYTIAFDEQRYSRNDIYALYLIDYDRNETTNLLHMDYNFYSETGAHAERFALQVAFAPNTSTDVEYTQVGDVLLSREGNTIRLDNLPSDATVTVYDAVGHLIEQHTASQLLQLTLQKGYYLLHIGNNQNSVVIDTFIP